MTGGRMNLNPEPLRVGDRDEVRLFVEANRAVKRCVECRQIKAFCDCLEGFRPDAARSVSQP